MAIKTTTKKAKKPKSKQNPQQDSSTQGTHEEVNLNSRKRNLALEKSRAFSFGWSWIKRFR